jgi:hypothetical protein
MSGNPVAFRVRCDRAVLVHDAQRRGAVSPCLGDGRRGIGATEPVARRLAANCNVAAAGGCGTVLPGQACAQLDAACRRGALTAPQVRTHHKSLSPPLPLRATPASPAAPAKMVPAGRRQCRPGGPVAQSPWPRPPRPGPSRARCQAQSCAYCQAEPAGHLIMPVLAL